MMNRTFKLILYFIYFLGATSVFLYLRFPSDAAKSFVESTVNRFHQDMQLSINQVRLSFPPGIQIDTDALLIQNQRVMNTGGMRFVPSVLAILKARKTFDISADASGGIFKGILETERNDSSLQMKIRGNLSGGRIEDLPFLTTLLSHNITGVYGGTIDYVGINGVFEYLSADLVIADFSMELNPPVDDWSFLNFNQVKATLKLDHNQLSIEECILRGPQINGKFDGSVDLQEPLGKSIINIDGRLRFHHRFLTTLKQGMLGIFFSSGNFSGGELPFKCEGTVKDPLFSINGIVLQ